MSEKTTTKKAAKRKLVKLYEDKAHPSSPWRGVWSQGGKRCHKWFAKRSDAEAFANKKHVELLNQGTADAPTTKDEQLALSLWRSSGLNGSLADVVKEHLERVRLRDKSVTLNHAIEHLVTKRKGENKRPRTIEDLEWRLNRFAEWLGVKTSVADIRVADVDKWLVSLGVSAQSRLNEWRVLHSLLNECVAQGWTTENVVKKASKAQVELDAVTIYTPGEAAALLSQCDDRLLPAVALGLFAGLRTTEIMGLEWDRIDLAEGHIRVMKGKKKRTRIVPITANLKAWLTPHAKLAGKVWPLSTRILAKSMEAARVAAGVSGDKHNAMRHSFGSYRLAVVQSKDQVRLEMGNTERMVDDHYNAAVPAKVAVEYFAIVPPQTRGNVIPMMSARASATNKTA